MRYDNTGQPTTGIEVDDEGRVLLWYRDEFGRLRSKHLLYCNGTRIEFRQAHTTIVCGAVLPGEHGYYIRIELPPDYKP